MPYIITILIIIAVGIFALSFVIALGALILFHPQVNAVLSLAFFLFYLWLYVTMPTPVPGVLFLFLGLMILDCIHDIVLYKRYYRKFDTSDDTIYTFDKLFVIKSLTSLLTGGYARPIFFLVVGPLLSRSTAVDIQRKLQAGKPLPDSSLYSKLQAKNYYYAKQIGKLEQSGAVTGNSATVTSEAVVRREKLKKLYPQKMMAKLTDMVAGDKTVKENRDRAEKELQPQALKSCCAYLGTSVFEKFPQRITDVMADKGCYSATQIKDFEELKDLPLMVPLGTDRSNVAWSEYFIIQALQPLVAEGIFEDNDFNDNDALDNHAYRYIKSTKPMPSQSPETNPLLALDDDDD